MRCSCPWKVKSRFTLPFDIPIFPFLAKNSFLLTLKRKIMTNNTNTTKHYFNFENIVIKGNIGSDISLKTKTKERVEFSVAVNKFNKQKGLSETKWFKIISFEDSVILAIKNNSDYKKGTNVEIHGEVLPAIFKEKAILKIVARQISFNIPAIENKRD
jgi:uncharacterized protein YjcR